jgi:energy-coupling factor transporter ATP-binding protein EcfA2
MDEPTAALDEQETERLLGLMRQLRTEGVAIVFILRLFLAAQSLAEMARTRAGKRSRRLQGKIKSRAPLRSRHRRTAARPSAQRCSPLKSCVDSVEVDMIGFSNPACCTTCVGRP